MESVCYLHNEQFSSYTFASDHPMKPRRLKMVHSLINSYGLTEHLRMYNSKPATCEELLAFHHPAYVKYLQTWVNPNPAALLNACDPALLPNASSSPLVPTREQCELFIEDIKLGEIFKINQGRDCPGFAGLYEFCQLSAGSSIDAADLVIAGQARIAINWMGGFHHARKASASGFCYINDIVLCILELLKVYPRVLYLDIDVHHGDGVEEAFYLTNRVMTVSFHQFAKDFFPMSGPLHATGDGLGRGYTVNVPLMEGMDNDTYVRLFKNVMQRVMANYVPDVVVVQCGADSLGKDMLGGMNLTVEGHGECLQYMKSFGTPMVLLGGGGYTIANVSRCWTYETALMLNRTIDDRIPENDFFYLNYNAEDYKIHFPVGQRKNLNTPEYIGHVVQTIYDNLKLCHRPSVPFHTTPNATDILGEQTRDWMHERGMRMMGERESVRERESRWTEWEKEGGSRSMRE